MIQFIQYVDETVENRHSALRGNLKIIKARLLVPLGVEAQYSKSDHYLIFPFNRFPLGDGHGLGSQINFLISRVSNRVS